MNPETLESLLLDRALGELSPPVAALLEEHLARDPAAARRAAALAETLHLARRSIADTTPTPALRSRTDLNWFRRAAWQARRQGNLIGLAKLAACLVLGIILGRAISPEPTSPETTRLATIVAAPAATANPGSHPKFWSLARAGEQRGAISRAGLNDRGSQVLWESPFKSPRVEDKP